MESPSAFPGITLLGLGPGSPAHLTREAWELLQSAREVYLRTRQHPTVASLPPTTRVESFDHLYQTTADFEGVYAQIVEEIIRLGRRPEGVIYAVPGHPFVAEATCPAIHKRAVEENLPVRVVEGLSFLEPVFTALGADPFPRMSFVDAFELSAAHHPSFPPDEPALIAQVHSQIMAAEIKLTLMAVYPDEHPVRLLHAAGTSDERSETLPLYQIDRSEHIGLLTTLYVPPLARHTSFESFQEIIAHLRAPEGCPWDRAQTHQTLRPSLLEETYEVLEALDTDNPEAMCEELGDLLLQIVLQAQIGAEMGEFAMADIVQGISTKLIRRHPHVFGDADWGGVDGVAKNWEQMKAEERKANGQQHKSLLDGVSAALPALAQASAYQKRATRVGFDWTTLQGVLEKIAEEVKEIQTAPSEEARAGELGDLFFVLVRLADWYGVEAETTLREANARFRQRFAHIEQTAHARGSSVAALSVEEMNALWDEAKRLL